MNSYRAEPQQVVDKSELPNGSNLARVKSHPVTAHQDGRPKKTPTQTKVLTINNVKTHCITLLFKKKKTRKYVTLFIISVWISLYSMKFV